MPDSPTERLNPQPIQLRGDLSIGSAVRSLLRHNLYDLGRRLDRVSRSSGAFNGFLPTWIAKPCASGLRRFESGFRALGDSLALMFCDSREDVNREAIGLGHVHRHKVDATLHQSRDEMYVAGETVQLGDDEGCAASPTFLKRRDELRPVDVTLAALDLLELGDEQGSVGDEPGNGRALGLKAQTALALAVGADPVISDVQRHLRFIVTDVSESAVSVVKTQNIVIAHRCGVRW